MSRNLTHVHNFGVRNIVEKLTLIYAVKTAIVSTSCGKACHVTCDPDQPERIAIDPILERDQCEVGSRVARLFISRWLLCSCYVECCHSVSMERCVSRLPLIMFRRFI